MALHYNEVIMSAMASQIISLVIVYSTFYWGAYKKYKKHQSSASLAFVRGIHAWPVNSPKKWPVTRKMFPYDDAIICNSWSFEDECSSCTELEMLAQNILIDLIGVGIIKPITDISIWWKYLQGYFINIHIWRTLTVLKNRENGREEIDWKPHP